MNKSRVLQLTGMTANKYGGLEKYFLSLSKLLHQFGYDSLLQYQQAPGSLEYMRDLKASKIQTIISNVRGNCAKVFFDLFIIMSRNRCEIVHAHFLDRTALFMLPLMARVFGVKRLIITFHSVCKFTGKNYRRIALDKYDAILAVSDAVAKSVSICGVDEDKISTHYLGVPNDVQEPDAREHVRRQFAIQANDLIIGCIAHDAPVKGIPVLLQGFAGIKPELRSRVWLLIVGIDPTKSSLVGLANQLGVDDRVIWTGFRDDVPQILKAVDVYAQPSIQEGLGLAVIEAMAAGVSIVCSRAGGLSEVIEHNVSGLLVSPGSSNEMTAAFENLLENEILRSYLGKRALDRYNTLFCMERSVRSLIENHYKISTRYI